MTVLSPNDDPPEPPSRTRPRRPTGVNSENCSRPESSVSGSAARAASVVTTSGTWKNWRRSAFMYNPRSGIVGPVWPSNFTWADTNCCGPLTLGRAESPIRTSIAEVVVGVADAGLEAVGRREPGID